MDEAHATRRDDGLSVVRTWFARHRAKLVSVVLRGEDWLNGVFFVEVDERSMITGRPWDLSLSQFFSRPGPPCGLQSSRGHYYVGSAV